MSRGRKQSGVVLDPWIVGAIAAALVTGLTIVLIASFPTSPWTWGVCGAIVVFAVVMYLHPRHWLKRRSSACLGIAGATAAIPAITGAVELPQGWVEFSTDASPWAAGLFGVLSLIFAWLDRGQARGELAERVNLIAGDIHELKEATVIAPPHVSLAVEKARVEARDPRFKVKPSATAEGVHLEVTEGEGRGQVRLTGPSEQLQKAHEKMKRGDLIDAVELGLRVEAVDAPGHPGETVELSQITFGSSTPASLTLVHIASDGAECGSGEIPGVIEGGLEKRFTGSLGDGLFWIELQIQSNPAASRPSTQFQIKLSAWEGRVITQLPGFATLHHLFSRLPEGGTLRFQLFHDNQFLVSGGFDEDATKQLAPIGATLHWLNMAREVATDLGADVKFSGAIAQEDTYQIEFARRLLDGETLRVTLNVLTADLDAHADAIGKLLEAKEPVSLEVPSRHFRGTILRTEVDLGPVIITVRDCHEYHAELIGAHPDDPDLRSARIRLEDVSVDVRRFQQQS